MELFLLQQYAVLLEEMGQEAAAVCWYKALLERFGHEKGELRISRNSILWSPINWRDII